jgi:hypothetical protein
MWWWTSTRTGLQLCTWTGQCPWPAHGSSSPGRGSGSSLGQLRASTRKREQGEYIGEGLRGRGSPETAGGVRRREKLLR